MSNKLIITHYNDRLVTAVFNEKEMIQVNFEEAEENCLLGNVYIGKVQNIVKNINAAFIEIAPRVMSYLSFEEAINPIFTKWNNNRNKVKIGDELVVQVTKDAVKTKAPVVSSNISFAGRFVVLVHGKTNIGISAKIADLKKREQLKSWLAPYQNENYGFVVRTNAMNVSQEALCYEIECLVKQYDEIIQYGVHKTRFTRLYHNEPSYICNLRDMAKDTFEEIITDDKDIYDNMRQYLNSSSPNEQGVKLRFYDDKMICLSNLYSFPSKIENALKPHVWLKSGGSIVIQPTEALTVIDVNTEKAIAGKKNVQETFFKINMEAATEIAKQIRLRNLSGIIIIDFIDMLEQEKKDQLMKELANLFKKDPVKTVLVDMTALGLVEVTRKKIKRPLHEQIRNCKTNDNR